MLKGKKNILILNGSKYIYDSTFTVLELIRYLGFNQNVIVIDYNGMVLEQSQWQQTHVNNQDSLEILSIAGGG